MISTQYLRQLLVVLVVAGMSLGNARANPITEYQVDVAGIANNDERGSASNIVREYDVGSGALITTFACNVNVTSYAGSYLSEMKITFSDSLGNGLTFTPGSTDDDAGTMDYAGFQHLGDLGEIVAVGVDGILRLEFHDGYKDLAFDEPEGMWNYGTLTFGIAQVPEPPTLALLLGSLFLLSRVVRPRHIARSGCC